MCEVSKPSSKAMLRWMSGAVYKKVLSLCVMRVFKSLVAVIFLLITSLLLLLVTILLLLLLLLLLLFSVSKIFFLKRDRRTKDYLLTESGCSMIFLSVSGDV